MPFINHKNYFVLENKTRPLSKMEHFDLAKQSNLLYRVSNSLLRIDDPEKLLQKAVDETKNVMDAFTVSIALYNQANHMLRVELINRDDGEDKPLYTKEFAIGEGVAGLAAKLRKIVAVPDIRESSLFINKNRKNNFGGIISVPMIIAGELIGVLNISSKEPRIFTESEAEFLTVLSTIIAAAIKNNHLYRKLDNQVKGLSRLFGVTSVTSQQTKNTISSIVNSLPALLESEKAHLLLLNNETQTLEFYASSASSDKFEKLPDMKLKNKSVSCTVLKTEKPILINNIDKSDLINKKFRKLFAIKKQISVPVMGKNDCLGVIHIINKISADFTTEDLKLASIVATRIAAKIENAELIDKLDEKNRLLDKIVSHASDGIIVFDQDGKLIVYNKYLENLFKLKAGKVLGLSFAKLIGMLDIEEKDKIQLIETIKPLLAQKDTNVRDIHIKKNDEGVSWLRVSCSHILDEDGNIEKTIFLVQDISADKELLQAKNDFISTSTHELRTPITTIKGYLSMMRNGDVGELSSRQLDYLNKAYSATERLVNLAEDFLSILKIGDNRIEFQPKSFELNELVREAIGSLKMKAQSKKILMKFNPQIDYLYCYADREKTSKIIENLLDNAIKYSNENGRIYISSGKDLHQNTRIDIRDNGVGISQKNQRQVFDKFTRINNPLSIKAGGTGLGLFIVKNLVERQGGHIFLKSRLGIGSTFSFTLPTTKRKD